MDDDHVSVLKEGAEALQEWHNEHATEHLNLAGADLKGLSLPGGAPLSLANLQGASLENSKLDSARMLGAQLQGAQLIHSSLENANLTSANLSDASLKGANLTGAVVSDANIEGCDFRDARLNRTVLPADCARIDFSGCNVKYRRVAGLPFDSVERITRIFQAIGSGPNSFMFAFFTTIDFVSGFGASATALVGWPFVRLVGSLSILTKASYAALVFVPLIAGMWSAIVALVDRISGLAPDSRFNLSAQIPDMPETFALAFFAALAVVMGHLVYEIGAGPLIKRTSRGDYLKSSIQEFRIGNPADQSRMLQDAMYHIQKVAQRTPYRYHKSLVPQPGRLVWVPSGLEGFDRTTDPTPSERKLAAIEAGAAAEYDIESNSKLFAALTGLLLYAAAIGLILTIVGFQSWSVLEAARWLPATD